MVQRDIIVPNFTDYLSAILNKDVCCDSWLKTQSSWLRTKYLCLGLFLSSHLPWLCRLISRATTCESNCSNVI